MKPNERISGPYLSETRHSSVPVIRDHLISSTKVSLAYHGRRGGEHQVAEYATPIGESVVRSHGEPSNHDFGKLGELRARF
jgi:hypothetical protein